MRDRIMRTIVFFDLPTIYSKDKRAYTLFKRFLINEGFIMMQESVYSKITLNQQQMDSLVQRIRNKAPKKGLIQVMNVTEKQYSKIEFITGKANTKIVDTEERLIIL